MPTMNKTLDDDTILDICDKAGSLRTDFTDEEIERIPVEKRPLFFTLLQAKVDEESCNAELDEATKNQRPCVLARDAAAIALGNMRQTTFIDEHRRTIAAWNAA